MPSPNQFDSSNSSTPPQSIPLRNLTRPPGPAQTGDGEQWDGERGRNLLSGGRATVSQNYGTRYERLDDASPSPPGGRASIPSRGPPLAIPAARGGQQAESPISPMGNPAEFQAAMGFAGLTVPGVSLSQNTRNRAMSYGGRDEDDFEVYPYRDTEHENPSYFGESDRTPLTDPSHIQPLSGARPSDERTSFQSVRFSSPSSKYKSRRLGDDLSAAEAGLRSSRTRSQRYGASLSPDGRTRSLSPSSAGALSKAGSMVRAMSQRVVNLSGESEILEMNTRRRQASIGESNLSRSDTVDSAHISMVPRPETFILPVEKGSTIVEEPQPIPWQQYREPENPLKGKSLGIFSPESRIRNKFCDLLVYPYTEPIILLLIVVQTILLALDSSKSVYTHPRPERWGSPIDYALLGLFTIFSLEIIARIIVSGFILNAAEYSTIDRKRGLKGAVYDKYRAVFAPQRQFSVKKPRPEPPQNFGGPTILRSFTGMQPPAMTTTMEQAQRQQLARRAFLRHSFNRLDFVAIVSFWIAFALGISGTESGSHLYIFRMLSCLRILRLLAITNGTAIILRSLKKATPLLLNVSFLIGFFWLLFAIVGVQSFKSSFTRQCVWLDPLDPFNQSGTAYVNAFQFCGGQFNNITGAQDPWYMGPLDNLIPGAKSHKGYLCPQGSICLQLDRSLRPYNGTFSFDNIGQSLELVFVVMSGNTFSDLMYYTMDSDYLAAALFFACGIVIMMLWLLNLLIAVITSSFQVIREESKASAFAANLMEGPAVEKREIPEYVPKAKAIFDKTFWFWIIIITYDLVCQAFRSSDMSIHRVHFIDASEIVVTILLLVEIILRFAVDWRGFIYKKRNWFDFMLAILTTAILIPPIRHSGQPYAWLTFFQIVRVYRIVWAVPVTRMLIKLVLGNATGIGNLMLFVFLMTFLVSIFAVQLFRGELPQQDAYGNTIEVTFATIWNAFLGMYQILSSENWTTLLYNITAFDDFRNTAWVGAVFFIGWFILANLILVNMFIAVIQENFDVSEDEKRMQQVKAFLHRKELGGSSSNLSLSAILRFGRSKNKRDGLDYGPATLEMLLKDAVVKDFLDEEAEPIREADTHVETMNTTEAPALKPGPISSVWGKLMARLWHHEPNPFYSNTNYTANSDETRDARTLAKEVVSQASQRKKAQREYLRRHPHYNKSLFLFKPDNPIRRLCQKMVGPGRGSERIEGVEPNKIIWYSFSALIYAAIFAMVLLACVTTPLYQKEYFESHDYAVRNWFVWTDMAFAVVFTVEAIIKVIADGFFWTPNAYFRSLWGFIDGLVLVTLWINVVTSFANDGAISRAVGAFKALRALRLLNVSDSARETFHSVIIVGGFKVFSAAVVSLSLLIPFAIYGVNLFNGKFRSCNDGSDSITNLTDCFGEYSSSPYSGDWPLLAPRVVSNPFYDFDNFASSLFILFQIVSQEGWVDVMWSAQSITGRGLQPQDYASQGNAVFFVVFNLLATIFILTLFISVFMRNYTEQTGVAFLTTEQRSWLELRKLLKQVSPSKRPSSREPSKWKDWCYKRAVRKHGRWNRAVTLVLVIQLILLLVETYPEPAWWSRARDFVFLLFTIFFMANIAVRIIGLSWARFSKSSWDIFSLFAVFGTFVTSLLLMTNWSSDIYIQMHKFFLVLIILLLIPRNDALDQLFKTAAGSLTSIGNLLGTWFVLFLVYAIAMTQAFGLTRFGGGESNNINFRTVPKAMILLFRTSMGEGWNQIMEDFANIQPPFCVLGDTFFDTDCGSAAWARGLFISWNILSMYIFTSLFVSLIYESFSYVYQRSSGHGRVNREELRRFKQAWATLDPDGTGFITKEQFPRLLGELSGVFEMRIYPPEHSVRRILEDVQQQPTSGRIASISSASQATGVDRKALNERLAQIDVRAVRAARARFNLFYEEIMVSADHEKRIDFTTVLLLLAHYNVINDSKSLRLEEFLRRRARLQRVEEEVRRRIVVGFFDTLYWSRRFKQHIEKRKSSRLTAVPQLGPEVFVDDHEAEISKTPRSSTGSMLSPSTEVEEARNSFISRGLNSASRHRRGTTSGSAPGSSSAISPQLSPNRVTSVGFTLPVEEFDRHSDGGSASSSRRNSGVSAENVLEVLDNSAWGESIRRSFTMRRPEPSDR
ncbi:BcCCH1, calcium channel protein [Xylogone sp. PMI_703]|nr:BcCCH1, calcium channel protein [Xylogone sp. PMI_703]